MASKPLVLRHCRLCIPFLLLVALLLDVLFLSLCHADLFKMADLVTHPELFDRKAVVVMGLVKEVQRINDQQGEQTFKFLLVDSMGILKVTSRIRVQEGDQVIVEGTFTRRRQGGRLTVYNEVNALTIRPLNQFNAELVG